MKQKRVDGPTPSGGDYSEIFYFNENGEPVDEEVADKCVIRECLSNGELINEIHGICN